MILYCCENYQGSRSSNQHDVILSYSVLLPQFSFSKAYRSYTERYIHIAMCISHLDYIKKQWL